MTELQREAEVAAQVHFTEGRDEYEEFASEIISGARSPKHGLTPVQYIGAFLKGIARNNFYYGYLAAKGFDPTSRVKS